MKASSPRWLTVMILGCMVEVFTVFLLAPDERIACQLSLFCVVLGFTLAFGSLFLKNYRILRVFNNVQLTTGIITDRVLFMVRAPVVAFSISQPSRVCCDRLRSSVVRVFFRRWRSSSQRISFCLHRGPFNTIVVTRSKVPLLE